MLEIVSSAFDAGASIPRRHTCEGEDRSPPLAWTGVPDGTRGLVLIVDDPDAPDPRAPRRTWVHWVVVDLPPAVAGLPENASADGLPAGAREGLNDWGTPGWRGPCPPVGRHRYVFKLYAVDAPLPGPAVPTKADVERAMQGHVLAEARLIGTYAKAG